MATRTIRAKFSCRFVTKQAYGGEEIGLTAVYGKEGVNAEWSKATPTGDLSMTISNPDAQGYFVPGKDYYLDISVAEDEEG